MKRSTYRVRIEMPNGGRYTVVRYATSPERARGLVDCPTGARIVAVSKMSAGS